MSIKKIFILEDEIDKLPRKEILSILKGHTITIAKNVEEAKHLYTHPYDLLLLDHDMEGFYEDSNHPNTGFQFTVWLVEQKLPPVRAIVHSQNDKGSFKMMSHLNKNGWTDISRRYFGPDYLKHLKETYSVSNIARGSLSREEGRSPLSY